MSENRVYETTYLVTPDLEAAAYDQIVAKFRQLLQDNGATITHQEVWGMQKLAYEIEGKGSAYYVLTEYTSSNQELVYKLEQEYTYDERIVRFLTVRLDKHAVAYNNKRKTKVKATAPAL
ncbi:MAG: 30S ribosomal protein S6 [Bacteroidia bacterium]|nr:30S ribosomal protein S6 [Bacteroidia bacterium]